MNGQKIYFDNAATTRLSPQVLDKMLPFLKENFGNPSSIHSEGRKTRVAIEEARETIASFINAKPGEIYFVSGGTEANNFALTKIAETVRKEYDRKGIVSDHTEHPSVLNTLNTLSHSNFGISLTNPERTGIINPDSLAAYIDNNTALLTVMHVNNETGAANDLKQLAKLAHSYGAYFHADAVQSFGKFNIDVLALDVDALSMSSHKIYGPKGIGALYVKSGTPIAPFLHGGHQERNMRGGTENTAAIVGFAEAVRIASSEIDTNFKNSKLLNTKIREGLSELDKNGIIFNSSEYYSSPYILSITFKPTYYKIDPETFLMLMDINGIAVSNGSACSSGVLNISKVLKSMGLSNKEAEGTIRVSFGKYNSSEEAEQFIERLSLILKKFRKT